VSELVALLGHPVAHSLSPRMQNAAFAARGLDWLYVAIDVPSERLEEAVRGLAGLGFAGANVTAPHKQAVARLVGSELPSVNTLVGGEGHSTDAAVLDGLGTGPDSARECVIGDGGAAAEVGVDRRLLEHEPGGEAGDDRDERRAVRLARGRQLEVHACKPSALRMTDTGAGTPVQSSNDAAPCATSTSSPSRTRAPAAAAAAAVAERGYGRSTSV